MNNRTGSQIVLGLSVRHSRIEYVAVGEKGTTLGLIHHPCVLLWIVDAYLLLIATEKQEDLRR